MTTAAKNGAAPEHLIEVKDLKMHFPVTRGIIFQRKVGTVKAVDGISFNFIAHDLSTSRPAGAPASPPS
jgi:ABC-type microcin C transport system duplicated ATPase subunit YejF